MKTKNHILIVVAALFLLSACVFPQGDAAPSPSPEPTVPTLLPPDAVVLTWSRIGGIAGFCDQLTIAADGRATATTCASSFMPDSQPLSLEDWDLLQSWLAAYGAYSDVQSDGAVADSMTVTLDFFGWGSGEAGEMAMQSLLDFAGRVFFEMYVPPATAAPSGPCLVIAVTDVAVYQRPSTLAGVFGTLAAGDSVTPFTLSVDGWYGFDPGVAQAANIGVFRNRWIAPNADIIATGDCAGLPVAPVVSPTACYLMAMMDVPVFAAPDESSAELAVLAVEGYAAAVGANGSGWVQIDLAESSQPQDLQGWIRPSDGNFNGPCDEVLLAP